MISKADAISSLVSSCAFSIAEDGVVTWIIPKTPPVTDQQINDEMARLQREYDAKDYQRKRATEYPSFIDYLDGVVKGDQAQIAKYIADCQAVKAKYPKG
jgi:tRNA A37 N6-isopentenylltransferase MiaA